MKAMLAYFAAILFLCFCMAGVYVYTSLHADNIRFSRQLDNLQVEFDKQQTLLLSSLQTQDIRLRVVQELNANAGDRMTPTQISEIAVCLVSTYDRNKTLTPSVIMGLIQQESAFDPNAVSQKGAVGLTQVLPSTALPYLRQLGMREDPSFLRDPVVNVRVCIAHLEDLLYVYDGNLEYALNAYFWGSGNLNYMLETNESMIVDLEYGVQVSAKIDAFRKAGLV